MVTEGLPIDRCKRLVDLSPLQPEHLPFAYALAVEDPQAWRWRYRGVVPPPQEFERSLWTDVAAGFVILDSEHPSRGPIGLGFLYGLNLRDLHGSLAIQLSSNATGAGMGLGAALKIADYALLRWPIRHLYLEVPAYNLPQFGFAYESKLIRMVGKADAHLYYSGEWHTMYTFVLTPEAVAKFDVDRHPVPAQLAQDQPPFEDWLDDVVPFVDPTDTRLVLDSLEIVVVAEELSILAGREITESAIIELETVDELRMLWTQLSEDASR